MVYSIRRARHADADNKIYGFGHLELEPPKGYISGLYFVPEVKGLGFGKKTVQQMFEICKSHGVTSVRLSATKTAKAFYEAMSFKQQGGVKQLDLGGTSLECFTMETSLP